MSNNPPPPQQHLDEEDDAAEKSVDPMQEEMKRLASQGMRQAEKRMKSALKKAAATAKQQEIEERKLDIEKERLEMEQVKEMHKKHVEMEKLRLDQQKQFAKASRIADEVKVDVAASQYNTAEKETKAKDDAMRKVGLLKTRLGAAGTGRRLTSAHPLREWLLELEVCNNQLNLERAMDVPEQLFYRVINVIEQAAKTFYNIDGLSADVRQAVQVSREAEPGSPDAHLDRCVQQCSIMYSHLFAASPQLFVIASVAQLAERRHRLNEIARGNRLDRQMSQVVEEEFDKMLAESRKENH